MKRSRSESQTDRLRGEPNAQAAVLGSETDSDDIGAATHGSGEPIARSVTVRAIVIALLLFPANAYWIVQMELVRYSAHPTTISLFFNTVFILVVLCGINALIARSRFRRHKLNTGELLLIYTMLNIGSCMAGTDLGQVLVPALTWPYSQANQTNRYDVLVQPYLPRWAMMSDVAAAKGFWRGNDTLYTAEHLRAWIPPALIWTAFMVVLLFVMQCVNVLIRKQWMENEKLAFPLTKIPISITDGVRQEGTGPLVSLWKMRLFWLGFVIAAGIDAVNALNYYYPSIPAIGPGGGQSYIDIGPYFTQKPWSAVGWTPVSFYPFVVGIGSLLPQDFLFSSWFFYIFWKLQNVSIVALGLDADPRMPYANYQAFGAYMMFIVSTVYLSRRYLRQVWRRIVGGTSEIDDRDEPMRYRSAFVGMAAGLLALIGFSVALGLAWWLAVAFFAIYLALALAITRMRAEMGTPVHDLHFTGPDWTLSDLLGPRAIGAHGLGVFSIYFWFNRAYRSHPMPFQMEGLKLAEHYDGKREMRGWIWAMLLAGAVGMLCAFWALLHCFYIYGGLAQIPWTSGSEPWDRMTAWMTQPRHNPDAVPTAIVVGFLFAAFLQAMRARFWWWPFHPLAYAVSGSWEMNLLWMPLLIAWVIKALILRYGGSRTMTRSLPFFYGLILGQFIPGSLMNIWGIVTAHPTYQFWQ